MSSLSQTDGTSANSVVQEYDVIIVGAGFSGVSTLHRLRKEGLKAHIFESASDFGGVWYWNRAELTRQDTLVPRVDSETPFYQLNIPEVYKTWSFSQRFPDHVELREYFSHIDRTLDLRKDVSFDLKVNSCTWDKDNSKCTINTENGAKAKAQFLVMATGLLHKPHLPSWEAQETFQGTIYHSSNWPTTADLTGKKVAVIGAGATAVQIVQELGKQAFHLADLARRPSYCLPMRQRPWTSAPKSARRTLSNYGKGGGFHFLMMNFNNVSRDKEANAIVYEFWKRKVRARLTDEKKQALMAPDTAPYYFGTKRTPLEHDYYDVLNQDNVEVVDLNQHPIAAFTQRGMRLEGEIEERHLDAIVCATGFDSFTGSLCNMGLTSKNGVDIRDEWREGVKTYMGIMMHGFPNAFMVYSPQAPTALANGPTVIECQSDLITQTISALRAAGSTTIEPTPQAESEWKSKMNAMVEKTLFPYTNSWWNTSNVPGKMAENQNYILGIPAYESECRENLGEWRGLEVGV